MAVAAQTSATKARDNLGATWRVNARTFNPATSVAFQVPEALDFHVSSAQGHGSGCLLGVPATTPIASRKRIRAIEIAAEQIFYHATPPLVPRLGSGQTTVSAVSDLRLQDDEHAFRVKLQRHYWGM